MIAGLYGARHTLSSHQLKQVAFLMGLPITGTKTVLESSINAARSEPAPGDEQRIVSVDMGIRNLAYCVLETPPARAPGPLRVTAWKRIDLLGAKLDEAAIRAATQVVTEAATEAASPPTKGRKSVKPAVTRSHALKAVANSAFAPPSLCKTAYDVTQDLLSYKPTQILIEQQRFRSSGGSAIQEWTVRVNMLESMLWACLHTQRQQNSDPASVYPAVKEVPPARVASFWTAGKELSLSAEGFPLEGIVNHGEDSSAYFRTGSTASKPRKKVEKKEKVNIVRSWLAGEAEDVSLSFEGDAAQVAEAFQVKASHGKADADEKAFGKLDDLADCLLQAVAWVRWEENRRVIWRMVTDIADKMH